MQYLEYPPTPALVPFIDCYWTLRDSKHAAGVHRRRVMPDICADIILNMGEEVGVWNGQHHRMQAEKAYLVGTMTTFQDTLLQPGASLLGIRFKPFGLSALLGIRLQGTSDRIEALDRKTFSLEYGYYHPFETKQGLSAVLAMLNTYFLNRINGQDNRLMNSLIGTVLAEHGRVSTGSLAQRFHTSERQLERKFREYTGVTLKEICNLTRFQYAYRLIQSRGERSLLDIAFEAGYYDHAHLTKHIKRYAGHLPSRL